MFKKNSPKSKFLSPKITLRTERSADDSNFRAYFLNALL
jgi:hypothetical protein